MFDFIVFSNDVSSALPTGIENVIFLAYSLIVHTFIGRGK